MKTYRGYSFGADVEVEASVDGPGLEMRPRPRKLDPRLDLYNHSPTGFAWGYGGSGPAQLALALLADVLGFAGTRTTGEAAFREGMRAVLIEREPQYLADIERRIKLMLARP
jgi:hypothetical protein